MSITAGDESFSTDKVLYRDEFNHIKT